MLTVPHASSGEYRGWYRFLLENHFLFDTLLVEAALELSWDKYDAIVLPDYQPMSDALAQRLDAFVAAGGVLIAVGRSGFRDETSTPRPAPALQSLGIETVEKVREDMRSALLKVPDKATFPRFADTDLIYIGEMYVFARFGEGAEEHLHLIPPHAFGPPERCYYTQETERPGFIVNRFGQGKAIYIPWLPGELFHRQGYLNTSDFVADLLEQVAGLTPVGGNLSPMVEVTHFAKRDGSHELVHMVNGSGHFGTSFFRPVEMNDVEVTIARAEKPSEVYSLVTESSYPFTYADGRLTIQAPKLGLFDAIRIR